MTKAVEFDRKKFKEFLSELDFFNSGGEDSIQSLLQYYCLHGNKENEFSAILAFYLQKYSREISGNFTAELNSSLPEHRGILVESLSKEKIATYNLTLPDNSDKAIIEKFAKDKIHADIQIHDFTNKIQHVIELKSDRCREYLDYLAKFNTSGKYSKNRCVGKLIADIKSLASLQVFSIYKQTTFWQGILVYSFQNDGTPFSPGFPKYINPESGEKGEKRRVLEIANTDQQKAWFDECEKETLELKVAIHTFLKKQDYLVPPEEIYVIKVAEGTVKLHDTNPYSGARVAVQSHLLFFEVKADEKHLRRIALQVIDFFGSSGAQKSSQKN